MTLINEAMKAGASKKAACSELKISVRTLQRWETGGEVKKDGRKSAVRSGPRNKLTEEERSLLLKIVNSAEYIDMPPSQIVPDLADKGVYIASESTYYRVLREIKQNAHRGRNKPSQKRKVPRQCACAPNQVWSWDITWLPGPARGIYFYLYLIIDIFSRKIVGWEIYVNESSQNASGLIARAVLSENIRGGPLVLHSDNGSPMKGSSLLVTLNTLGVEVSHSRPGVSSDNPYSESVFRTLKYRPVYPHQGFKDICSARAWVNSFVKWYNEKHHHSGLKYITPEQRHQGLGESIMLHRQSVYAKAKQAHPERWSGNIRDFSLPDTV
jgi:putative transposase